MRNVIAAVVALAALAVSLPAFAECAWVLWLVDVAPTQTWSVAEAFKTEGDCGDRVRALIEAYRRDGYTVTPGSLSAGFIKSGQRGGLHCLPDTIDPRMPKSR